MGGTQRPKRAEALQGAAIRKLRSVPLTPGRWGDLQKLFGERGACGGCWCMYWRLARANFEKQKGEGNKRAMKKLVRSGSEPGLLAYVGKEPVGWCALEPREAYCTLERSRLLKRLDQQPVWSVVCFLVDKRYRNSGVSVALLKAAVEHARKRGGRIVEGYPVEPTQERMPDVFAWTGIAAAFRKAGFREVARLSATRPIMRRSISAEKGKGK